MILLRVSNLSVTFHPRGRAPVTAVDDVSFDLDAGETLGLVGESGSGKTTVARAVLRLVPVTGGRVRFAGRDLASLSGRTLRRTRRDLQIVFQDPGGSLNPRMRVGEIVAEPLIVHRESRGAACRTRVGALLERCGLGPEAARKFPHEFSGGQRQRIAIARAMALRPKLVVCDEPTSALDVSVQARILGLLKDLQDECRVAYLFISHDMAVVEHMSHRIGVMRAGRLVEMGPREQVIDEPQHAYTRALLAAVPGRSWQPVTSESPAPG